VRFNVATPTTPVSAAAEKLATAEKHIYRTMTAAREKLSEHEGDASGYWSLER
jgi:hypothetical protein